MTRGEMILKAKQAKSAEELLALAKENGIEITEKKLSRTLNSLTEMVSLPTMSLIT